MADRGLCRCIRYVARAEALWVSLFLVLLVSAAPAAVNVLDNPAFEDGATSWTGLGGTTLLAETTVVHGGAASCLVTNRSENWDGAEQSLLGKVEKGTTLVGTAWVRLDNCASDPAKMQIKWVDDGGTHYYNFESRTVTNTAWAQLSGTWVADWTGDLTYLVVRVSGPAIGVDFYVDDVSVSKREIMTNPGFESGTVGWHNLGSGVAITTDTTDYFSGGNSVSVSNRTATWHGVEQDLMGVVENGDVIEGSARVKVDSGTDQTIGLAIKYIDDTGAHYPVIGSKVIDAEDGWVQLSGSYALNYTGTLTYLSVRINVSTSLTSFHADDVYLRKIEVLHNGGFNTDTSFWNTMSASCDISTAQKYEGAGSVYVTNRTQTYSGITQDLLGKVQKGDLLNGSVRVRLASGSGQSVGFTVKYMDDTGTHYGSFGSVSAASDDWYRISGLYEVDWVGTLTYFQVRIAGGDIGTSFYADAATVTRYQGPEGAAEWRSSLYPENWTPGYSDGNGNFLHDFSYAGYHQGRRLLPDNPPGAVYDVTASPYYADDTGTNDATAAIQDAIDDAGAAGGGVVYLPAGTYRIIPPTGANYALLINDGGVVLRGDGPAETFLFNDDTYMRKKSAIYARPVTCDWHSALSGTTVYATADAMSPTFTIPLTDSSSFAVGDWVVLRTDCTQDFIDEHEMTDLWSSSLQGITLLRKVTAVDTVNDTITIDIPTRYYMKTRDNFRAYKINPPIEEVGIEHLSIGMRQHPGTTGWGDEDFEIPGTSAYDVHGSHFIQYYNVANGWVRDVHTYRPAVNSGDYHMLSNIMLFNEAQNVTVADCIVEKPQYEGGGGNGYGYTLSGSDILVVDCIANHTRHNYDFKSMRTSGNAIVQCMSMNPRYSSDFHMHLSPCNLFDSMDMDGDYLEARYRPWGTAPTLHGQTTSESVFWNTYGTDNCVSRNRVVMSRQWNKGYVIGTTGPVHSVELGTADNTAPEDFLEGEGKADGLSPQSLYYDQLARRLPDVAQLGTNVLTNGDFEDGTTGWGPISSTIGVSTDVKRSGTASGYVTNRTQTYSSILQLITNSVEKGQMLEFVAWVRLDNAASDNISMQLKRTDGVGARWISLGSTTVNNTGWTRLHATWTADWTGTLSELRFYFPSLDVGTNFYIDDVSVTVTGF